MPTVVPWAYRDRPGTLHFHAKADGTPVRKPHLIHVGLNVTRTARHRHGIGTALRPGPRPSDQPVRAPERDLSTRHRCDSVQPGRDRLVPQVADSLVVPTPVGRTQAGLGLCPGLRGPPPSSPDRSAPPACASPRWSTSRADLCRAGLMPLRRRGPGPRAIRSFAGRRSASQRPGAQLGAGTRSDHDRRGPARGCGHTR